MIKANPLYLADHLMIAKQWLDDVFIKCLDVIQKSKKLSSHYGTLVFERLKSRKNTVHCENAIYWTICKRTLKKTCLLRNRLYWFASLSLLKSLLRSESAKRDFNCKITKKKGGRKIKFHDFRTKKLNVTSWPCSLFIWSYKF